MKQITNTIFMGAEMFEALRQITDFPEDAKMLATADGKIKIFLDTDRDPNEAKATGEDAVMFMARLETHLSVLGVFNDEPITTN